MFMFKFWRGMPLFKRIMVGFIVGIALGVILGPQAAVLQFLGTILIRLFSMLAAPLILCLLVTAVADVGDFKTMGKIGGKTILTFICTSFPAVLLGLVLANLMNLGSGVNLSTEGLAATAVAAPSALDTLVNIIPSNPFAALNSANLLQIIFFAMLLGLALTRLGEKGKLVHNLFKAGGDVMKEVMTIVLNFAPYGIMGLMAWVVGTHGLAVLMPFAKFIVAVYIGSAIFVVLVYGVVMVGLIGKVSPLRFFKEMKEPILFSFATSSSFATMPLTLAATKRMVGNKVADFVVPFGSVINMDGTAIYQALAAIFAAHIFGIELTLSQQFIIVLSTVLASIGTAGIPGAGLVSLSIVLTAAGLPIETMALLAGIDRIVSGVRSTVNILGDAATSIVVAKTEGELELADDVAKTAPGLLGSWRGSA
ncbi:MAG: dicarboxylate/amino acid:cation symporter [Spirochaetes bacterium]|nr:dicarboxylate/amino acid:cation symporter [Spirochaetota bacterium]